MTRNFTAKNSQVLANIKTKYNAATYKRAREIANETQSEQAAVEFVVTTHIRKRYQDLERARLNDDLLYVVEIEYTEEALANDVMLRNGYLSQACDETIPMEQIGHGDTGVFLFADACAVLPHIDRTLVSEIKLSKVCETFIRRILKNRAG